MSPAEKTTLLQWVTAITALLGVLATWQTQLARHEVKVTSDSLAVVVRERVAESRHHAKDHERMERLEDELRKLMPRHLREAHRAGVQPAKGGTDSSGSVVRIGESSPGPVEVLGRVVAAPFKATAAVWRWLKGG